jgi:hypothetical protein
MNTIDEPASRVESPAEAPLQAASQDIWEQKYHLRGRLGKPVERNIDHCYQRIADTIDDSMANILRKLYEADITLKSGAAIGYEFSTLRPRGAHVTSAGAQTSGLLSFPLTQAELEVEGLDSANSKQVIWCDWSQFSVRWRHGRLSQQQNELDSF